MRVFIVFMLLLTACASRGVQCDRHLTPVNDPAANPHGQSALRNPA